MVIVRQYVESFAEVVEFYERWKRYAMPQHALLPGLPAAFHGLGWAIEQQGNTAWCSIVLQH